MLKGFWLFYSPVISPFSKKKSKLTDFSILHRVLVIPSFLAWLLLLVIYVLFYLMLLPVHYSIAGNSSQQEDPTRYEYAKACLYTLVGRNLSVSDEVYLEVVEKFPECIAVAECSQGVVMRAIDKKGCLASVANLDPELMECVIRENPDVIYCLANPDYDLCSLAFKVKNDLLKTCLFQPSLIFHLLL